MWPGEADKEKLNRQPQRQQQEEVVEESEDTTRHSSPYLMVSLLLYQKVIELEKVYLLETNSLLNNTFI